MSDDAELYRDIEAERRLLSAMLDDGKFGQYAIDTAADLIVPEDLVRPAHQVAFRAMVLMRLTGTDISVPTLQQWIGREGDAGALGAARAGEYLLGLKGLHIPGASVADYAEIVSDRAVRRRWDEAAIRIRQLARECGDPGDLNGQASMEAAKAEAFGGDMPGQVRLLTPSQLAATDQAKAEPLICGPDGERFVNRMDRVVTVGAGGSGKTVLLLQVAAGAAVGMHPFQNHRFDPVRVLWLDLELPAYQLNENIELVFRAARHYGNPESGGRFQVLHRPRGLNLLKPGNAQLLTGLIRKSRPDLIAGGPVYKMHGDTGERGDHTGVMDYFDEIRDRFGCALWLETHPPKKSRFGKQDWSPAGSSRWGDWPEVGFAMVPSKEPGRDFDVVHFRGMRDRTRPWPEAFSMTPSGWPWQATWPPGTLGGGL